MKKDATWWERLRGALHSNHHDYPSSVALISPSLLPRTLPRGPPDIHVSTWSDSARRGHADKVQM